MRHRAARRAGPRPAFRARYVEIADASHGVTIQWPDRVNALLLEHLEGPEAGLPAGPQPAPA